MSIARSSRVGALSLALALLASCASAPKNQPVPPPAAAPAPDPSYDWHGLLVLPFGTVLKDSPFALHEVLMFRDAADSAQTDEAECYAIEQSAPRFLALTPSEYLLCFKHDHLARVQATVPVRKDDAAQVFHDACELWQRQAGAVPTAAGSGACDGRDGAVAFSGLLDESVDRTDSSVTIRLDALNLP